MWRLRNIALWWDILVKHGYLWDRLRDFVKVFLWIENYIVKHFGSRWLASAAVNIFSVDLVVFRFSVLCSIIFIAAWRDNIQLVLHGGKRLHWVLYDLHVCILVACLVNWPSEAWALLILTLFQTILPILLLEFVQKLLGTILDQLTLSVKQLLCAWDLCWRCMHGSGFRLDTEVESRSLAKLQVRIDIVLTFILRYSLDLTLKVLDARQQTLQVFLTLVPFFGPWSLSLSAIVFAWSLIRRSRSWTSSCSWGSFTMNLAFSCTCRLPSPLSAPSHSSFVAVTWIGRLGR